MQEDIENRSVSLAIRTSKLTAQTLKNAISKYLAHRKGKRLHRGQMPDVISRGKQTVKQLVGQNQGVECGRMLQRFGYRIRILNTINFKKSMRYNPFAYIHSEKDILKLVTALIANTKGDGKTGDDFWVKAETLLYTALIGYIHHEAPVEEQNFSTLIEFINAMEVREDDESFENTVDMMFKALEKEKPQHFAVRQYKKYKLAAGKTAKSILISCGARLAPFDIQELRDLTAVDELHLDTLGDRKTALFLIMSDTDDSFNFLISLCYTQLFNLLCEKADDVYGGKLPVHVRCLIDEAANIGQIPKLEKLVATIRSREISACLVLQAQSQLKALYKDNADTIIGNMDARIFLGGAEPTTLKELSQALGKETIDTYNTGQSRGREVSHSLNYQKLGKELMSIDELSVLDGGKCILQLRGVRPFLSDKYDITQHPHYRFLSDANPKNKYDIEKALSHALRRQEEKEAQYIATALEIYVTGSLNVFNHRTNVNIDNRIVCYDIKELGKQLKKLGMLVVQDQVWNRVTVNRAEKKATRYYIDEFHLLLKEEQTAAYSVEIWKRFRKWGGIPTGITQNVKDLLSSREVENIFENSDYIYMLNQAAGDRQILAKQLNISPHQLSYVTHSGEGEGLLFYGHVILPFVDRFPKDTELYRIMTTKLQETAAPAGKDGDDM